MPTTKYLRKRRNIYVESRSNFDRKSWNKNRTVKSTCLVRFRRVPWRNLAYSEQTWCRYSCVAVISLNLHVHQKKRWNLTEFNSFKQTSSYLLLKLRFKGYRCELEMPIVNSLFKLFKQHGSLNKVHSMYLLFLSPFLDFHSQT